jgi:serine/threonine protein phosphatase PrpC
LIFLPLDYSFFSSLSFSGCYSFLLSIGNIQETKLSVVCEKVLDRCLAPNTSGGEGCDNMTMILVRFKNPTPSETELKPEASQAEGNHDEPSSSN